MKILNNIVIVGTCAFTASLFLFYLPFYIPSMGDGETVITTFYLFWWFAWSIMIGQFTSRFVGGLRTQYLLLALLVIPSIPLAIWFSVLYFFFANGIDTTGILNIAMIIVGVTFVINSLDSLIQ